MGAMQTTQFVQGKEWEILNYYGYHETGNRHQDCPICEKKKKFRLHDYQGKPSWICVCGNGDMWSLLMTVNSVDFKTLANQIDQDFHNTNVYEKPKPIKPVFDFAKLQTLKDTPVIEYLNSRGITNYPRQCIKYSSNEWHNETATNVGAMVSVATDDFMNIKQVHRTYLNGAQKLSQTGKKLFKMGEGENLAIRMFPSDSCLGIAEGIETALSAGQIYNMPTWATMNTAFLKKFRAPIGVNTLFIFADNDNNGAGLASAFECAHRNILGKNDVKRVIVRWPEVEDFNDMLLNPCKTFEWELKA